MSRNLYAETAAPGPVFGAYGGEGRTDAVIIGGGIAGLSCALHLAERGIKPVLLEAHDIGWGASGRNGGQVNPGLKLSPSELEATFGKERGGRLIELGNGPDLLFGLVARYDIACAAQRNGTIRAVKSERQGGIAQNLAADYAAHGMPVTYLSASEVETKTGTGRYRGALFDPRGGSVNPLAYTRGLAAAASLGASIFTGSPVTAMAREGDGWRLTLPGGTLRAGYVALCANAYQGALWPGLAQSQVPVYSMITATAPLPEALRATIMPANAVVYEQADITVYYRMDDTGRLLMGGRSPSREITPRDTSFLRHYAQRLWPDLAGTEWTHDWNGQLAMTTDHLPHVHEPAPGLTAILGCNGRGVALMTALGARLAARIATGAVEELALPVTPVQTIPMHRFWKTGVTARVAQGRVMDWLRP